MALRQTKKISELTALESASLQTTLLGVDNGTTYKITLDVLEDAIINMVSRSTDLRLDSLEVYTASANAASDLSPLNSFTSSQNILNSAFTTGINARLQTSSFNEFSASVNTRIIAATNEQSFNGLVSGSSQLTSSYDSRYVLSGSITQTTWNNISGKPDGLVSQSTNLSSLNTFTASYFTDSASIDNRIDSLESWSSSLNSTFATDLEVSIVSSSVAATIGVISQNTGLVTTSSFNSYTASISTASLVTSITNLNTYTASVSTASLVTSITNLNTYTASQSTSSLVNRLNAIENVSGSWITESETGSFLTSLNGAISSSSQLTSSYDTRYTLSGSSGGTIPDGTVSGSSQLTSSYDARYLTIGGDGVISGSSQITGVVNLANLSATSQVSASVFVGGFGVPDAKFTVIQSKAMTFWPNITYELVRMTTGGGVLIGRNGETNDYGLRLDVSGSTRFTGNMIITGSLLVSNGISGSIAATNNVVSSSAQITSFGFVSGSYETTGRGIISSSADLVNTSSFNSYTASISTASLVTSITQLNTYTASVSTASLVTSINNLNTYTASQSTASLVTSINALNSATSSYLSSLNGAISSSSQLTSSFDTRYALSGSGGTIPVGTISGSSQLTASFDLRYLVTGSVTSSINALNTFSASENTKASTLATYTSSLNIWTSSVATTGSNSFNGNQTITGSLTVSSIATISSSFTANSSSLTLNSGSNLYIQNNGIVQITGSLNVSGSSTINNYRIDDAWTSYSVAWTSDGTNPTLNNGTLTGYYKLIGKTCFVRVKLVIGSTSSVGTGAWQFSLPFTAVSSDGVIFSATMLDNGINWYAGVVNGTYGGFTTKTSILCTTSGSHTFGAVTPTTPFTWATGDSLMFNGSYEIA